MRMKTRALTTLALAGLAASSAATTVFAEALKMTTEIPSSITAPNEVETSIGTPESFDGVPTGKTVEMAYDYLDRRFGEA